jgi:hypothetical protein
MNLLAAVEPQHVFAWAIMGGIALWAIGALFVKARSDARCAEARATGDPSNLTLDERAANREKFARELGRPKSMNDAHACFVLGAVLLGAGFLASLAFDRSSLPGLAVGGGVVFLLLGMVMAFGGAHRSFR